MRAPSERAEAKRWSPSARTGRNSHCAPTGHQSISRRSRHPEDVPDRPPRLPGSISGSSIPSDACPSFYGKPRSRRRIRRVISSRSDRSVSEAHASHPRSEPLLRPAAPAIPIASLHLSAFAANPTAPLHAPAGSSRPEWTSSSGRRQASLPPPAIPQCQLRRVVEESLHLFNLFRECSCSSLFSPHAREGLPALAGRRMTARSS